MSEMTTLSGTKPQKCYLLFCVKTNANCLIILNSVWQNKGREKGYEIMRESKRENTRRYTKHKTRCHSRNKLAV
jgi:hypothetical protein